jgi:RNA polymerase sigma-70 factor, ECF subfamily
MTSVADAETLFALYEDRLRRYLGRASGETELARDLTQEVFLRVSRVAIPVAPDSQLAGWLFRIARNVALDHHRQRHRRPEEALGTFDRGKGASQETTMALNHIRRRAPTRKMTPASQLLRLTDGKMPAAYGTTRGSRCAVVPAAAS